MYKNIGAYLTFLFWLIVISILLFAGINWVHIDPKSLTNWWVGLLAFGWILLVVKVPWDVYFEASDALADAALSKDLEIAIDPKSVTYLHATKRWALVVALILHVVSAAVLYMLEEYGITTIGYIGSGLALLLTVVRPSIRLYQYVSDKLKLIRSGLRYPREDVLELRNRVTALETSVERLSYSLNLSQRDSWASDMVRSVESIRGEILSLRGRQRDMDVEHRKSEEQLSRKAEAAISQLNEDSQALNHVREIIRYFKTA